MQHSAEALQQAKVRNKEEFELGRLGMKLLGGENGNRGGGGSLRIGETT